MRSSCCSPLTTSFNLIASIPRIEGIVGDGINLTVEHLADTRPSQIVFNLTARLLSTKWREPGEEPKAYLFGQLKRSVKYWLDHHLKCVGGTHPARILYLSLADRACERITVGITAKTAKTAPINALLIPTIPLDQPTTSTSTPRRPIAGRQNLAAADQLGHP